MRFGPFTTIGAAAALAALSIAACGSTSSNGSMMEKMNPTPTTMMEKMSPTPDAMMSHSPTPRP